MRTDGDGKSSSSASLMSAACSANVAHPSSSHPGNPPPMSRNFITKPCRSASSNTVLARRSALWKAPRWEQPLPTWKQTPTTFSPKALARANSSGQSPGAAPNLFKSGHCASASSVCTRMLSSDPGNTAASFSNSATLSNTVRCTPAARACSIAEACLHGLANTMRSAMSSPRDNAKSISSGDAQSKPPEPRSLHTLHSVSNTAGCGLHFTA
mmetsp:Transcript_72322/g.141871  ORF Transcript_72322/g.141871 Transcript_72322/m.141871 type:complete len:212 (-) Transcript_72322:260-895(-)